MYTSALNTSREKSLKQLMLAWCTSNPRLSNAIIVETKTPGLEAQIICMLTIPPSLTLTSTCKYNHIIIYTYISILYLYIYI